MKNLNTIIIILGIYLISQAVGLYVGSEIIGEIQEGEIPAAVEQPESVWSSATLFLYILIITAVLLIFIKFKYDFIIKALIVLAIFVSVSITLFVFFGAKGILISLALVVASLFMKNYKYYGILKNSILILAVAGVGGYLGASLGIIPAIVFLIGLSIYDIVAVFGTKHMITLAESGRGRFPFMFTIPFEGKGGDIEIGTGDFAIPIMFTVSILKDYEILAAGITALFGTLGFLALFYFLSQKERRALPALPPICLSMLLGFGLCILLI